MAQEFTFPNTSMDYLANDKKRLKESRIANIIRPNNFCGEIYKITSKTSGKSYIGQTRSHTIDKYRYREHGYLRRWNEHVAEANSGKSGCIAINRAILLYGESDFTVELLDTCDLTDSKNLDEHEEYYIANHNTLVPTGYNIKRGGDTSPFNEETNAKISNALKSFYESDDNRKTLAKTISNNHDVKRIKKYKDRTDLINCDITYVQYPKSQYINVRINLSNGKHEDIMFGKGKHIIFNEAAKRAKELLNAIMPGKQLNIYNQEVLNYFQNN